MVKFVRIYLLMLSFCFHNSAADSQLQKLTARCNRYLCENIYRTPLSCTCSSFSSDLDLSNATWCSPKELNKAYVYFNEEEKTSGFTRACRSNKNRRTSNKDNEVTKSGDGKNRTIRKAERQYLEYHRKTNITELHRKYVEAYSEALEDRVTYAVDQGTIVGRFAGVRRGPRLSRSKRSTGVSPLSLKSANYYTVSNAPSNSVDQEAIIAAAFSDWAAKAPLCFRERVSSQEPPEDFTVKFVAGANFLGNNEHSVMATVNGRREIQFNTAYHFKDGQARANVQTEVSLDAVILHQSGCMLGVPQSSDGTASSAMYTLYDANDPNIFIHSFERSSIQQYYGTCHGSTDAMTNIVFTYAGVEYTSTYITRETAIWEYSYTLNRAINNPIRIYQMFGGISGIVDAMMQVPTDPAEDYPLLYVFKGTLVYYYRYDHNGLTRMLPAGSESVLVLSRNKLTRVDAAFWSDSTSTTYLFSGNKVCRYDIDWTFIKCNKINVLFPTLGNEAIDEAYQKPVINGGQNEYVFFRGNAIYTGFYSGTSWVITYKGNVPNQQGYVWNDLCENLC